MNGLLVGQLV